MKVNQNLIVGGSVKSFTVPLSNNNAFDRRVVPMELQGLTASFSCDVNFDVAKEPSMTAVLATETAGNITRIKEEVLPIAKRVRFENLQIPTGNVDAITIFLYVGVEGNTGGNVAQFKNYKIEIGETASPYTPHHSYLTSEQVSLMKYGEYKPVNAY